MTLPRYSPSDKPRHATRRFRDGRMYTPCHEPIVQAFLTILARACDDYDIGVAAWSMMSNHTHLYVFDRDPVGPSRVSAFRGFMNSVFAKWLNSYWSSGGVVFEPSAVPNDIVIVDVEREIETVAYIENNPVEAGIVWDTTELDGATSRREHLFEPVVVERPESWFRPKKWPKTARVQLELPPSARDAGYDLDSWYSRTRSEVEVRRQELILARGLTGLAFSGLEEHEALSPEVCGAPLVDYQETPFTGTSKAILNRYFSIRRRFRRAYLRAMERVRGCEIEVSFPYGTDRMVRTYGFAMRPMVMARAD